MDFVLGLENDPGKIGVAAQRIDHHPLHLDVESVEDIADQFVGQRALVVFPLHGHGNGAAHARLDVDDKALLVVADENGQGVLIRGENAKYLHSHHICVHVSSVPLSGSNDNA